MGVIRRTRQFIYYARIPAIIAIDIYQRLFSPDHSFWAKHLYPEGFCRFKPSCSMYGKEAIKKYGLVKGGIKTAWRVLRCNPWSKGGVDEA